MSAEAQACSTPIGLQRNIQHAEKNGPAATAAEVTLVYTTREAMGEPGGRSTCSLAAATIGRSPGWWMPSMKPSIVTGIGLLDAVEKALTKETLL